MLLLILQLLVLVSALSLKIPLKAQRYNLEGRTLVRSMEMEHFSRLLEDEGLRRVSVPYSNRPTFLKLYVPYVGIPDFRCT